MWIYDFFQFPTTFLKWHSEGRPISKWNFSDNLFQPLIYFLLKIKLSRQENITGFVITKKKWEFLIHKGWKHKTLISPYIRYYNKLVSCRLIKHLRLHIQTYVLWNKKHKTILIFVMSTATKRKSITGLSLMVLLAYNRYIGQF